jgi:hypothetical protein
LPEFLKTRKERRVAGPWQAAIEEHLRGGKNNAAVDVVLDLPLGQVADADWTHPAIPAQAANLTLGERNAWDNCVNRAQAAILAESRNVDDM